MGRIAFDRSRLPIVVATIEGQLSDDDITEYLRTLGALLREETGRGVVIVDGSRAQSLAPQQRKRMGEWVRAHRSQLKERGLGCAFVFGSAVARFVLSSIFLIQRPPMPYVVVGSLAEALAWAEKQVAPTAK